MFLLIRKLLDLYCRVPLTVNAVTKAFYERVPTIFSRRIISALPGHLNRVRTCFFPLRVPPPLDPPDLSHPPPPQALPDARGHHRQAEELAQVRRKRKIPQVKRKIVTGHIHCSDKPVENIPNWEGETFGNVPEKFQAKNIQR